MADKVSASKGAGVAPTADSPAAVFEDDGERLIGRRDLDPFRGERVDVAEANRVNVIRRLWGLQH